MKVRDVLLWPFIDNCCRILIHDRLPVGVVCSTVADPGGLLDPYLDCGVDTLYYIDNSRDLHITIYN